MSLRPVQSGLGLAEAQRGVHPRHGGAGRTFVFCFLFFLGSASRLPAESYTINKSKANHATESDGLCLSCRVVPKAEGESRGGQRRVREEEGGGMST